MNCRGVGSDPRKQLVLQSKGSFVLGSEIYTGLWLFPLWLIARALRAQYINSLHRKRTGDLESKSVLPPKPACVLGKSFH